MTGLDSVDHSYYLVRGGIDDVNAVTGSVALENSHLALGRQRQRDEQNGRQSHQNDVNSFHGQFLARNIFTVPGRTRLSIRRVSH